MDIQLENQQKNSILRIVDSQNIALQDKILSIPCWLDSKDVIEHLDFTFETMSVDKIAKLQANKSVDIIIVGLEKQRFIDDKLKLALYQKNIAVEVMNQQSACHIFNVLLSEYREVALLLL